MAEDKSRNPDPRYNKLAIGVCPDQWGVWFPEDPKQIPWNTALDEMAQIARRHFHGRQARHIGRRAPGQ